MTATLHLLRFYVNFLSFYPPSILNFKCWSFALACQNTNTLFFKSYHFSRWKHSWKNLKRHLEQVFLVCCFFLTITLLFLFMPNWPLRWYCHLPKIHSKKGARKIVQFLLFPCKAGLSVSNHSWQMFVYPVFKNSQYKASKNYLGSLFIDFIALKVKEIIPLLLLLMSKLDAPYCIFLPYPSLHIQWTWIATSDLSHLSHIWPWVPDFLCLFT